jgi:glutathione peroxidase
MSSIYDFTAETIDGRPAALGEYRDKVVLIVNTASKCGFTWQYSSLEALHRKYAKRGLVVLGFPCNQFGGQEPGSAEDIKAFCSTGYDVTFPMMGKVDVNGPNAHPLYGYLKSGKKGLLGTESIKWNFTKFLVDRQGRVVDRYPPVTDPKAMESAIEALL